MSEVAKIEQTAESTSLIQAIERAALNPAVDVDKMERLFALQERIMAKQAEIQFNSALARVQENLPKIEKKSRNTQTDSNYAKLEVVNAALIPVYSREGFSISWGEGEGRDGCIRIEGELAHSSGHSRKYHIDIPLDDVGVKGNANKTKVHATGSSISYGRRYLTMMMFNASTYDDVDGNGSGELPPTPEGYDNWELNMTACADEGIEQLEKAFKESSLDFRKYITKYKAEFWASLKKKARGEV